MRVDYAIAKAVGEDSVNRRRFLRQTAKGIAGLIAANAVPIPATKIIPVAETVPAKIMIRDIAIWKDINIPVHDLTGLMTISRELLADYMVPMQLIERSMMDTWNEQIERTLSNV